MAKKSINNPALTQDQRWQLLARQLIRKELLRRKLLDRDLAKMTDRDLGTISRFLNGASVQEETWFRIGRALGWGDWLDFVCTGSMGAVTRYGDIDQSIRDYAIERLREIAELAP